MAGVILGVATVSLFFGFLLGAGACGSVWDDWAIKNHYAYRDPVTGVIEYDPLRVREFWMKHGQPTP